MDERIELFISYAQKDDELLSQLETHLGGLKQRNVINTWHRRKVGAGDEVIKKVDENLKKADVILLLVSADFLASDYCFGKELEDAMKRHDRKESKVVPILLRRVAGWKKTPFGKLQAFPRNGRPLTLWRNEDEAFADVVNSIEGVIDELHAQRKEIAKQKKSYKEQYKKKLEQILSREKKIGSIEQQTLDELQEKLGLTFEEVQEIKNDVFKPKKEYEEQLNRYEDTIRRVISDGGYPFSDAIRNSLEGRQEDLRIRTEDAKRVEYTVLREYDIEPISIPVQPVPPLIDPNVPQPVNPILQPEHNSSTYVSSESEGATETSLIQKINGFWSSLPSKLQKSVVIASVCGGVAISGVIIVPQILNNALFSDGFGNEIPQPSDISLIEEIEEKFPVQLLEKVSYKDNYLFSASTVSNRKPENRIRRANNKLNNGELCAGSYAVAVPVPATGDDGGNKAAEMLRGFSQAQDEINDGCEIGGKGIELLIVDDGDDLQVGRDISKAILKLNNILAVVGHWTSNVTLEAAQEYEEKEMVLITPISISEKLTEYDRVFLMNPTSEQGAEVLANYLLNSGYEEVSVVYDDNNDYSQELGRKFVKKFTQVDNAGLVKREASFNSLVVGNNLTPSGEITLEEINGENKALVLFPAIKTIDQVITLLQHIEDNSDSLENISIVGDMANLYTPRILGISAARNMVLGVPWHFDFDPDPQQQSNGDDFACEAFDSWDGRVSYATAMSYSALKAVAQAMREGNLPTRESIYTSLISGIEIDSPIGTFSFNEDTRVASTLVPLVQVKDPTDEERKKVPGETFDFIPLDPPSTQRECETLQE